MRRLTLFIPVLFFALSSFAQNWESVKNSPEYLYGEGWGNSVSEADKQALAALISKIAVSVSSTSSNTDKSSVKNGNLDEVSQFTSSINTYAQATLTNTEQVIIHNEPDAHVGRWIRRAEIQKIFASRIAKIKDMVSMALKAETKGKADDALRNYYWALTLLKSLQSPNEVTYTDDDGNTHLLVTWIPAKMKEVFEDLSVRVVKRTGDDVELFITYKGKPVSSVDYTYFDGQCWSNIYSAKDGRGVLELAQGNKSPNYQLKYEFEYRGQAPRHAPEAGTVQVNNPKNKHTINVTLVPQFSTFTFRADNNAEIWIDDKQYGTGSCKAELGYGTYLVECRLVGHRPSSQELTLSKENSLQPIQLKSPVPMYGSLDINSTPGNAEVWLDGKQIGTTPMFVDEILVGGHKLEIKRSGYKNFTSQVSIGEGATNDVMATLEKGFSSDGRTFTVNGVTFSMIPVEDGNFTMGATSEQGSDAYSDEKPTHTVTLSNYMIGETEVTQALWQAVLGTSPSRFEGSNRPVEQVSWNDCQTFISKLNALTGMRFRLPTEAEWEFAARGGTKSRGYKYCGSDDLAKVAWYDGNSGSNTHDVKTKSPNELGIYDMSGNVWEWCSDWSGSYSAGSQNNPVGAVSGTSRVIRGGCWDGNAGNCRVSYRDRNSPDGRYGSLGLRLALSELRLSRNEERML